MRAPDDERGAPVTIQILDKDYRISCAPEEQHGLMDSARLLDQRMREVRQNGRVIGADRIAVMAALNLIFELMRERDEASATTHRLQVLQERVAGVVEAAGVRADNKSGGLDAPEQKV